MKMFLSTQKCRYIPSYHSPTNQRVVIFWLQSIGYGKFHLGEFLHKCNLKKKLIIMEGGVHICRVANGDLTWEN